LILANNFYPGKIHDHNYTLKECGMLDMIYPVGSIYTSMVADDPAELFGGGEWERIKGRVLVGIDEFDGDFNTAGKTGGAKAHTLSYEQMPVHNGHIAHQHQTMSWWGDAQEDTYILAPSSVFKYGRDRPYIMRSGNEVTMRSFDEGGGQPHNNLQPYKTAYMWQRTA